MKDNIFLILFCVFFIILDTLVLGYSIGRIYPPIPIVASAQSSVSNSFARKEKQQEEEKEESSLEENVDTTSQQKENFLEEKQTEEKQEITVAEQTQNLQNQQQETVMIEETNMIEPEIPYTYTREEINAMLIIDDGENGGSLLLESDYPEEAEIDIYGMPDEIINGETCYIGVASWNEYNEHKTAFYIGNQSLKVYNDRKEYIGMATENFLSALE